MPTIRLPASVPGAKGLDTGGATVSRWLVEAGAAVSVGAPLVELELLESFLVLESPVAGVLSSVSAPKGKTVKAGDVLAEVGGATAASSAPTQPAATPSKAAAMSSDITPILMPAASNSMEEGTIVGWKVKVGDRISVGQVICEIETDKATVDVEATHAGRLAKIVADAGAVVPVKQPIAYLAENDAALAGLAGGGSPAPVAATAAGGTASVGAPPASNAKPSGEVTPILMPAASNSMEEGTIVAWKVNPGDRIAIGQVILEIETDKATVDVEATHAGRLARIIHGAGAVVAIKQPIAYLAENDADVDIVMGSAGLATSAPVEAAMAAPAIASPGYGSSPVPYENGSAKTAAPVSDGRLKASPAAKKLARDRGLDLATVGAGSGPEGRILSTDLDRARALAGNGGGAPASAPKPASPAKSAPSIAPAPPVTAAGQTVRKPLSKMRKAIANNLQMSKQTVPHFYIKQTILADALFDFYKTHKPATGCTLNDVILLALGRCIAQFPAFRSRIEGNEIVELPRASIGVAVSIDDGLVVPVIMSVDGHTLASLPAESKRIVEGARKGKLENAGKGVFSVSNMGMLGVEEFSAIINPPESGILAVSGVKEELTIKDGAMRIAKVMKLTLSVDHRVVDGALAAAFMNRLKELLEHPEAML